MSVQYIVRHMLHLTLDLLRIDLIFNKKYQELPNISSITEESLNTFMSKVNY
jgi:hypothetical protein